MTVPFATSARSSVGIEWELMLADRRTGDLVPRAPEVFAALPEDTALERFTVTQELLTNTLELTSGVGQTVAAAVDDIADAIETVRSITDPLGVELMPPVRAVVRPGDHRQDPLSRAHRAHAVVGAQHDDLGHPRARRHR